jgi:hypothetical protein
MFDLRNQADQKQKKADQNGNIIYLKFDIFDLRNQVCQN